MSFRNAIRSRFKKSENLAFESKNSHGLRNDKGARKRSRSMEYIDESALSVPGDNESCRRSSGCEEELDGGIPDNEEDFNLLMGAEGSNSDPKRLELQNKELQMQLLSATITNQNLVEEIKGFKEKRKFDKLEKELKEERIRYEKLLRKYKELRSEKSTLHSLKLHRPKNPFSKKIREGDTESLDSECFAQSNQKEQEENAIGFALSSSTESLNANPNCENVASSAAPDASVESLDSRGISSQIPTPPNLPSPTDPEAKLVSKSGYLWNRVRSSYYRFLDDFKPVEELGDLIEDQEGEPLSPRRLKDNISRFSRAFSPISNGFDGVKMLLSWKSPTYTLVVFSMLIYSVWNNWIIPLLFGLILLRLCLNYLKYRLQWSVDVHFLSEYEQEEPQEKDSRVSTQISFVVQVARKCQNVAGDLANILEKLNNLFTWKCPEYTAQLMKLLFIIFILSSCLSTDLFLFVVGVYGLIKIFLIDYIFMRFPRLRLKYDSFYQLWIGLPTNNQYGSYTATKEVGKYLLYSGERDLDLALLASLETTAANVSDQKPFFVIFNLPHSEGPLPSWKHGKRCILFNKDKSLSNVFKHGKLYLTRSFLCFERQKDKDKKSRKHVVIPLCQITKVEKTKPFSWVPGVGLALEISIFGLDKPLLFGLVISRDDVYEGLMQAARQASLPWAAASKEEKERDRDKSSGGKEKDRSNSVAVGRDKSSSSKDKSGVGSGGGFSSTMNPKEKERSPSFTQGSTSTNNNLLSVSNANSGPNSTLSSSSSNISSHSLTGNVTSNTTIPIIQQPIDHVLLENIQYALLDDSDSE